MTTLPRTTANSSRGSGNATLNLDELGRENDPGAFSFVLGGRTYEMVDPQSLDYRDLVDLLAAAQSGEIKAALGGMLDTDDVEDFWENRIPAFKLNTLVVAYLEHFGIDPAKGGA